jgi:hypothetical protein
MHVDILVAHCLGDGQVRGALEITRQMRTRNMRLQAELCRKLVDKKLFHDVFWSTHNALKELASDELPMPGYFRSDLKCLSCTCHRAGLHLLCCPSMHLHCSEPVLMIFTFMTMALLEPGQTA